MDEPRRYWPFEVLAPERQTPLHKGQIRFLETAYREGFEPYFCGLEHVAKSGAGREGMIYRRGARTWWGEIFLEGPQGGGRAFIDDFDAGADAVLRWLWGEDLSSILARIPDHEIPMPRRKNAPSELFLNSESDHRAGER